MAVFVALTKIVSNDKVMCYYLVSIDESYGEFVTLLRIRNNLMTAKHTDYTENYH